MREQELIDNLKVGDYVYQYRGNVGVKIEQDYLCYHFYKITGETKQYWKIGLYSKDRKKDLKEYGGTYSFSRFYPMDERSTEMKKLKEEWSKRK